MDNTAFVSFLNGLLNSSDLILLNKKDYGNHSLLEAALGKYRFQLEYIDNKNDKTPISYSLIDSKGDECELSSIDEFIEKLSFYSTKKSKSFLNKFEDFISNL